MKDYKNLITEFYQKYNPEQLDRVDYLLNKYKGREEELLNSLEKKYITTGTQKIGKTGRIKKEAEKAPKNEPVAKSGTSGGKESKAEWEKRREEILRQVRERSESLKKKRESNDAKSYESEKTEVLSSFQKKQSPDVVNDVHEYEKTEVIEPPYTPDSDRTEILETVSAGDERTEVIESAPAPAKRTRSVARYSEEEIKPKLKIPNPGSMSAAQRAAFWAEQLEVKEQLRLRRLSEKALNTKYDEPEPQPPKKEQKAIPQAKPAAEKKKAVKAEGNKSYGKFLWIGLIALLLGGAVYIALKSGILSSQKETIATEEVPATDGKPAKKTAISPEGARDAESEGGESGDLSDENKDSGFELSEGEDNEERIEPSSDEVESPREENIPPASPGKLNTPCFLVSYATLSSEDGAMSSASELRNKGFKTGYYFIPDYIPGGKSLYKVYAGPFNTAEEAEETAERIRPFSEGAYVMYLQ